eukprot:PhM_4_TR13845/c0_g1_i1/m.78997
MSTSRPSSRCVSPAGRSTSHLGRRASATRARAEINEQTSRVLERELQLVRLALSSVLDEQHRAQQEHYRLVFAISRLRASSGCIEDALRAEERLVEKMNACLTSPHVSAVSAGDGATTTTTTGSGKKKGKNKLKNKNKDAVDAETEQTNLEEGSPSAASRWGDDLRRTWHDAMQRLSSLCDLYDDTQTTVIARTEEIASHRSRLETRLDCKNKTRDAAQQRLTTMRDRLENIQTFCQRLRNEKQRLEEVLAERNGFLSKQKDKYHTVHQRVMGREPLPNGHLISADHGTQLVKAIRYDLQQGRLDTLNFLVYSEEYVLPQMKDAYRAERNMTYTHKMSTPKC